jgi:hypothetical protein
LTTVGWAGRPSMELLVIEAIVFEVAKVLPPPSA